MNDQNILACPNCHYEKNKPDGFEATHSNSGFFEPRYVGNGFGVGFDLYECQYCNELINAKYKDGKYITK